MVDISPQNNHEPSFGNKLVLDCLRISDSEDWDAEIDSMSSAATYSSEAPCEYNTVANNEITGSIKSGHLHHGFASSNDSTSQQKQYFDNEVFPPVQSMSKQHSSETSSFTDKNSHYYEQKDISYEQDCAAEDGWDENNSNIPQTKSDESIIQPTNVPSERRFVKDILTNFQDSIPHDISNESSVPNSDQTFDYENMFHWDYMEKLTHLEAVFTQEDKAKFLDVFDETLNCTHPYSFLLYLVENHYSNVLEGKKSLAHVALTQFDKWRSEGLFTKMAPTEMEKDRALWIVTTRKLYLFDLCNKVFKLDSKGNEYLQRHIYYLLQSKKRYKEVSCQLF